MFSGYYDILYLIKSNTLLITSQYLPAELLIPYLNNVFSNYNKHVKEMSSIIMILLAYSQSNQITVYNVQFFQITIQIQYVILKKKKDTKASHISRT
jgi:hypothetical protein